MSSRRPLLLAAVLAAGCGSGVTHGPDAVAPMSSHAPTADQLAAERADMVRRQILERGVGDGRVLEAMERVPRHRFVPDDLVDDAYRDSPLPIGHGQTISQPYIVALMSEELRLDGTERVLEIGTGSGYQAAVLGELAAEVYTIEIVEPLAERSRELLAELGYENVHVRTGDGYRGWPEHAPFDAIMVTAAPDHVPQPLLDQLAPGGRLVIPVGERWQDLVRYERTADGVVRTEILPVRFVPMTGEAQGR